MNIFVDTGAFYALADSSDIHHASSSTYYSTALKENRFFTSSFVLVETWLLIRNKLGYHAAQKFYEGLRRGIITLLDVSAIDLETAWIILREYSDQEFSIVDATSFAVMERLGLSTAFSFDEHFRIYRFRPKNDSMILVP